MVIEFNNGESLQTYLNKYDKIIVDVYAKWCGPCKLLSNELDQLANKHTNWTILRIDSDIHSQLLVGYNIRAIPTVFIVVNGKIVNKFVGFKPLAEIEKLVEKH